MVILITLYSFLMRCTASRIIVLQSFDVLANGSPKDLLENSELCSKGYQVIHINGIYSNGIILVVEVV